MQSLCRFAITPVSRCNYLRLVFAESHYSKQLFYITVKIFVSAEGQENYEDTHDK